MKLSNASLKKTNQENDENKNQNDLVYLNFNEQSSEKEIDSRNISALEFGVTNMVDTLGDFSLKILNSQVNDVNNNLVKITNSQNSLGSNELDLTDYEYVLTSRTADSQNVEIKSKLLDKKISFNEISKNLFVDTTTEKNLPKKVKQDSGSNEISNQYKKIDIETLNKFSNSSSSIPSDASLESINKSFKRGVQSKSKRKKDEILSENCNDFQSLKITFV